MSDHEYHRIPLSFGAGVNSVALVILLVNEGWRAPILFSDTGTEWPDTYAYLATFSTWLASYDLAITVLGAEWRGGGKEQLSLIDYCRHYRALPLPASRWCTLHWKIEPIQRWCKANGYPFDSLLIGISAEEHRRQPLKSRPLVDRGIDRSGCARIIVDAGLPLPRKSGCYICPFQTRHQWRDLRHRHPDLFEYAAHLEDLTTARLAAKGITKPATLDLDGKFTLRQIAAGFDAQSEMFDIAHYYQPCMCRL